MVKRLFLLIAFLLVNFSFAQSASEKDQQARSIRQLRYEKDKVKKAALYYNATRYYIDYKTNIDSVTLFNKEALGFSRENNITKNIALGILLEGEIAIKRGNITTGNKLLADALAYAQKHNLKKETAAAYNSLALHLPMQDFIKKEELFLKSIAVYREIGAYKEVATMLTQMAIIYNSIDKTDASINSAKQAVAIKKKIKDNDLFSEYAMLALNYRLQGNYKNALAYALAAEKISGTIDVDGKWLSIIHNLLGTIYSELKFYDKSVEYYKKAIAIAKENNDAEGVNSITLNTAHGLHSRGKETEALAILDNSYKYYHGDKCNIEYPSLYILIYTSLKKYQKARPFFELLQECDNNQYKGEKNLEQEKKYYAMITFLLKTGNADKTYIYIDKLKELVRKNNDLFNLSQFEKTYFEVDSATGNYLGAIRHLKNYKRLNDSLFNMNSNKQFASLQLKYETEKKDKNIRLLTQKSELQQAKLENEAFIRYIFIGSLVILCIILGLLYNRYCMKRKTNVMLEAKRKEINRKNKKLQQLVDEKEWLLKEIHHRVKNNLQIVISLLNTQSAYLDNEDALEAIQNSQHRMHAMSLIHQKLYQTENLSSIDMSWYIKDLAGYLKDSFDNDNKIKFNLNLLPVELDVAQAVPLGLILNEAISNAIKYAFPDRKGIITILLEKRDEHYFLEISDNGVGLPKNYAPGENDSLGMNLMTGLAEQLDGNFSIQSDEGVTISINFIKREAAI